ncbi:MAG: hypothetical protein ABJH68_10530 [Ilumatobacter sp.]|uniref:hypothetical protein n=1 Tax=Ilumatobacter sp. TaxID=1967498 RepID=UPI003297DDBE
MTTHWKWAACLALGAIVVVVMVRIGMEPRLVLVGCIMLLGAATWLLFTDLGVDATPIVWRTLTETDATPQSDRRVAQLRARVRGTARSRRTTVADRRADPRDPPSDEIVVSLLAVIDDHLLAEHGIDRVLDPDAAANVLGEELTRFVLDPSARVSMTRPRSLAHTVGLIEAL